jgi:hypothetical protein
MQMMSADCKFLCLRITGFCACGSLVGVCKPSQLLNLESGYWLRFESHCSGYWRVRWAEAVT